MNLRKMSIDDLFNIAKESRTEDLKLLEACYNELMRRRKIREQEEDRYITKMIEHDLVQLAKKNMIKNPKIAIACYKELVWRYRIEYIEELMQSIKDEHDLVRLDDLLVEK
ncbi:MAG: hypothetical protein ACE5KE_03510 [Methanosarcinales archaeon]